MTSFQFSRKNVWRKPARTVLIMLCVAVAFLIYGLTASYLNGTQGATSASDSMLGVMSAAGRARPLPMAHMARIAADPDVAAVAYMARLRGFLNVEKNVVAISAIDPELFMLVNGRELGLTPALVEAIGQRRDRVLVGRALAEAKGWSIGQRITVTAFHTAKKDGSRDWRFEVAGIFEGENASTDTYFMISRYDYINAARSRDQDTVTAFIVRPRETASPGELAARIDAQFANSAAPTRTQTEKQFLESFLRQYADVGLIVNLITGASFVTLLMIVVNTMIFAVRERTVEIGVLKTLGFSGQRILALVLGETLFVFVVGGSIGLALAKLATVFASPTLGLVFSTLVLAKAAAIIVILGLATGALPAINAMRIPIIAAFRTR